MKGRVRAATSARAGKPGRQQGDLRDGPGIGRRPGGRAAADAEVSIQPARERSKPATTSSRADAGRGRSKSRIASTTALSCGGSWAKAPWGTGPPPSAGEGSSDAASSEKAESSPEGSPPEEGGESKVAAKSWNSRSGMEPSPRAPPRVSSWPVTDEASIRSRPSMLRRCRSAKRVADGEGRA
jgi:hypothetical protein